MWNAMLVACATLIFTLASLIVTLVLNSSHADQARHLRLLLAQQTWADMMDHQGAQRCRAPSQADSPQTLQTAVACSAGPTRACCSRWTISNAKAGIPSQSPGNRALPLVLT